MSENQNEFYKLTNEDEEDSLYNQWVDRAKN